MEANKLDRCFVCKTEAGKLHEYLDFYSDTKPKV